MVSDSGLMSVVTALLGGALLKVKVLTSVFRCYPVQI